MTAGGLTVFAGLAVICVAGLRVTGDRRLISCLFWLLVWGVVWAGFSIPLYQQEEFGPAERSGGTLLVVAGLTAVLCGFVVAEGMVIRRARWCAMHENPDDLLVDHVTWPAFRKSAGAVGVVLVLLTCYELASAASVGAVSGWVRALVLSACGVTSGAAVFSLAGRRWSVNLAEAAMGLTTLGVAAACLLFLPSKPVAAEVGFPMVFTALMVGLAVMAGFWIWIGQVWQQQLDDGVAWTAAGRIAKLCARFSFFVACLALINGSVMAVWPRLGAVGVFDDSLGRVTASVGAHLFLLLVVLWSGRVSRRAGFGMLGILVGFSLVVFVYVRARPLVSTVHQGSASRWISPGSVGEIEI